MSVCLHIQANLSVAVTVCAGTRVSAYVWTSAVNLNESPLFILPSFTVPFYLEPAHSAQLGWPSIPKTISCLFAPVLRLQIHHHTRLFKVVLRGLNSGIHACMLSTLQTEPRLHLFFLSQNSMGCGVLEQRTVW